MWNYYRNDYIKYFTKLRVKLPTIENAVDIHVATKVERIEDTFNTVIARVCRL